MILSDNICEIFYFFIESEKHPIITEIMENILMHRKKKCFLYRDSQNLVMSESCGILFKNVDSCPPPKIC